MAEPLLRRCAIYTRTSTDEGLRQDYNSLAAQRDSCAAFIRSQRHEGWIPVKGTYEDGGFSGGNMDRPALQRLLTDVAHGKIDIIVLYKIDRLTRSLRDFARLAESFEAHNTSFVAVTQQFNTASSMGRLTLNILLTFAQFEREVTGDRIRDKIASSSAKGLWMGGGTPLGYDLVAKKLVINPKEAVSIRYMFTRFLQLRSMSLLRIDLLKQGIVSKERTLEDGNVVGGNCLTYTPIHHILTNPVYRGHIRNNGNVYPGIHRAIIEPELFNAVQTVVKSVAAEEAQRRLLRHPALLRGILFDDIGEPYYPVHTDRGTKVYRYYASRYVATLKYRGGKARNLVRVSAKTLDDCVIGLVGDYMRTSKWLGRGIPPGRRRDNAKRKAVELARRLEEHFEGYEVLFRKIVRRVEFDKTSLRIEIDRRALLGHVDLHKLSANRPISDDPIVINAANHGLRCGLDLKLVLEDLRKEPEPDHRLIGEVLRGISWFTQLSTGRVRSAHELALKEGYCDALVSRRLRLAFLAPDIVEAILEGRQPTHLTAFRLQKFCPLPSDWGAQRKLLLEDPSELNQ